MQARIYNTPKKASVIFDPFFTSGIAKCKIDKIFKIRNWVRLRNKQHCSKELLNSFPMNGHSFKSFLPNWTHAQRIDPWNSMILFVSSSNNSNRESKYSSLCGHRGFLLCAWKPIIRKPSNAPTNKIIQKKKKNNNNNSNNSNDDNNSNNNNNNGFNNRV